MPVGGTVVRRPAEPIRVEGGIAGAHAARRDRRARGGRGGSSTSWSRSATGGRLTRGRAYARAGPGAVARRRAGPGRRRAVQGSRPRAVRRSTIGIDGRTTRRAGRRSRRRSAAQALFRAAAAGRRDAARDRGACSPRSGVAAVPRRDLDMDVLVPRLGRAVQAPGGGALPAGRGVRRRPVPGAGLARPQPRAAAGSSGRRPGGGAGRGCGTCRSPTGWPTSTRRAPPPTARTPSRRGGVRSPAPCLPAARGPGGLR